MVLTTSTLVLAIESFDRVSDPFRKLTDTMYSMRPSQGSVLFSTGSILLEVVM